MLLYQLAPFSQPVHTFWHPTLVDKGGDKSCPWNPDTYLNVFLICRHWVWLHGAPVSSISRLSLLNYGATSIQKVLYRTVEASLPSSVTIYLLCEALIKISFRLKKNVVCDIFSYIENVNLIQSICQVSMKMM